MTNKPVEMTIWGHLEELRKRLLYSLITLVFGMVIAVIFSDFLLNLVSQPIGGFENLLSIQVTENLSVYFRITMLGGFILALPLILIQLILFVSPGLKKTERAWLFRVIPLATILFGGGVAFAYFIMLPTAIPFLVQFPGPEVLPKWRDYVSFVTNLLFWIGVSFETPLIMFVLAKFQIISAKGLLKQWRYAVIIIAVIAAVATPTPDPVNMALLMAPLLLLYLLGILLAALAQKKS